MTYPALTATYAAILGLLYTVLSAWVIAGRGQFKTLHGDGGIDPLNRRIRAHGNFAEYVPLTLLLIAFLEMRGAHHGTLHGLLGVMLIARILHPIGMVAPENSLQQYACRATGIIASVAVLVVTSILLLL